MVFRWTRVAVAVLGAAACWKALGPHSRTSRHQHTTTSDREPRAEEPPSPPPTPPSPPPAGGPLCADVKSIADHEHKLTFWDGAERRRGGSYKRCLQPELGHARHALARRPLDLGASVAGGGASAVANVSAQHAAARPGFVAALTVVLLSYDPKNARTLRRIVCHYCATAVVARVVLAWNNVDEPPPELGCDSKLLVVRETRNTLVNRYAHWDRVETSAVLISDDDIVMCEAGLKSMLWMHRQYPSQIIGTSVRGTHWDEQLRAWRYDGAWLGLPYALSVGQMNLLHVSYLRMFMELPRAMLQYVSTHKPSCEDLTLHFMVANHTNLPPIYFHDVQHRCRKYIFISDDGAAQMHEQARAAPGEWTLLRSYCINRLAAQFGRMPLVTTNCSFGVMSGRHH